ncbi:hypothetical protein ACFWU5_10640 [Nocardia sp. NPDC058640]|uniref:hypothetical protein n=1 Tax=Nocardia sp. NPDC058640 TaxID=3346571 RepID=UPI00365C0F67
MLTINFDDKTEWWVSGAVFDRLFEAAVSSGAMPERLRLWQHVANANGGFFPTGEPATDINDFRSALQVTAQAELPGLASEGADWTYKISLEKLITAIERSE